MTPTLIAKLAIHVYSKRWAALVCTIVGVGAVVACAAYGVPPFARLAVILAGPVIGLPWAVFCAASWFHPEYGSMVRMVRGAPFLPLWLLQLVRWYGAVFLAFFVVCCAVAWPVFAYFNLWLPVQ